MKKTKKEINNLNDFSAENNYTAPVNDDLNNSAVVDEMNSQQPVSNEISAPITEEVSAPIAAEDNFASEDGNKKKKKKKSDKAIAASKSKAYTIISIILHILSYGAIVAMTSVLGVECYKLVPYYSFWPFVGVILAGVLGLVFMVITLIVTRKKSRKTIMRQTVSVVLAFFCLSSGFGLIVNYVLPDIIAMATQSTIYVEDLTNNASVQAERNAELERRFILSNLLNGNYAPQYSYKELSRHQEENSKILSYDNAFIQRQYNTYTEMSRRNLAGFNYIFSSMSGYKLELYNFIYNNYILNDFDYAFNNVTDRKCFALALTDNNIEIYSKLAKEGFNNERIQYLFTENFKSMNHDGYHTFDDPLLLYAQMPSRMTVPIVLRLLLDNTYTYTQPVYDDSGKLMGYDGVLFTLYDPDARDAFENAGGEYDSNDRGVDANGWIIHKDGYVERPMKWCVLDMDGNNMSVAEISLAGLSLGGMDIGNLITTLLPGFPDLIDAIGGLLTDGVGGIIEYATNGASLSLGLCLTDDGALAINVVPSNVKYGVLGYQFMSWIESNNLLFAVINVVGLRNWMLIFGSVGVMLVVAAGVCRENAYKIRKSVAAADEDAEAADETADGAEAEKKKEE